MTIAAWLSEASRLLKEAGIGTSRLDALVLLSDELDEDKAWILAHPEHILQIEQLEKLSTKITQRTRHIPLAYIRGFAEFYGRNFVVNEHVLVPRPETESMIDALKKLTNEVASPKIIDVGTGSGCLAITAGLEVMSATVIAIDIDKSALDVAKSNAERLDASLLFVEGDLLMPIKKYVDNEAIFILANLPYVPPHYPINEAASHEPKIALFSEDNGLAHYKRLFAQIQSMNLDVTAIITESLETQHDLLESIANSHEYILTSTNGLVQAFVKKPFPFS
jgi:release factor glutamine methyltransferase